MRLKISMTGFIKIAVFVMIILFPMSISAMNNTIQLRQLVGWTITAVKTIDGYVKENGSRSSEFEGCEFDRVLIFTDGTTVTCNSYGYQYAHRPTAIIFSKSMQHEGETGTLRKILVNGTLYDVY